MSSGEFWSLTPLEIYNMVDGYQHKQELDMQKIAWHAANIMNALSKKKVTVKQLLGKEKQPMSQEQRESEFQKLTDAMKKINERRGTSGANRGNIGQNIG